MSSAQARVLIIGAGSRGTTYARAIDQVTNASVVAVAEPVPFKRQELGKKFIWKDNEPRPEQEFDDWRDFILYEQLRRKRQTAGEAVEAGVDTAFVCVLDTQHAEIIIALAPLKLHIMSEKPLATTLNDCLKIYASLLPAEQDSTPERIFGIGHVLRYSPHNIMLRSLLLEQRVIGDILSMEHTEPVGYWHFAHSYVRGNWRKESTTAPSLLTKSCHDIDLLLWILCSPTSTSSTPEPAHIPSTISSTGHLSQFRHARKPLAARNATNCLSCPIEQSCAYSARKIYKEKHLDKGNTGWPGKIVHPEIESIMRTKGHDAAEAKLLEKLAEDYDTTKTSIADIDSRPWFGRCVWESANDVCDDQIVTMTWDDDLEQQSRQSNGGSSKSLMNRFAKTATFHQIAQTEAQCQRRGRVYGTNGEIEYDSRTIRVFDFLSGSAKTYYPEQAGVKHGGGDEALVRQFISAVEAVNSGFQSVKEAQNAFIGCTLADVIRSHAAVFAAEEARRTRSVVDWKLWWAQNVEQPLKNEREKISGH